MDKLILEGVRCFGPRQEIPIRPLTLLVGENSTGKTTFQAMLRLAADIGTKGQSLDFNEDPFNLGAFDQIASLRGTGARRADHFSIGFEGRISHDPLGLDRKPLDTKAHVAATFRSNKGQPFLSELRAHSGAYHLRVTQDFSLQNRKIEIQGGGQGRAYALPAEERRMPLDFIGLHRLLLRPGKTRPLVSPQIIRAMDRLLFALYDSLQPRPYAIAPIRMKPSRTYDPQTDMPRPEGNHVPMILRNLSEARSDDWKAMEAELQAFGAASGLFRSLAVRRLGNMPSDPFQIMVGIGDSTANLVDVGYGVSQVLPILVDALLIKHPQQICLMQQPEVHLHPRAQAELGTFLGYLVKRKRGRFIVETHSNYLVDRVRLEIRDKKLGLKPEHVIILYFRREGPWVKVHPIEVDELANVIGAPPGYRDFFLKEQAREFGL